MLIAHAKDWLTETDVQAAVFLVGRLNELRKLCEELPDRREKSYAQVDSQAQASLTVLSAFCGVMRRSW